MMRSPLLALMFISSLTTLVACQKKPDYSSDDQANIIETSAQPIKINQVGYQTKANKLAIIPDVDSTVFSVIATDSNSVVYSGQLSDIKTWELAGQDKFKHADFSSVTKQGDYKIRVNGLNDSAHFTIADDVYEELHKSSIKAFYYNRASIALTDDIATKWQRPAGHLDDEVLVHQSAASEYRPEGTKIASSKGWYDAGDYGKYIVNSGIATYTLLASYAHHTQLYNALDLSIPESSDNIPDIINEIKWNLDWMATMQDKDGSVYHKLTTLGWPGKEMPHEDTRQRFVIGKSSAAAYDFAATMAAASRVFNQFEGQYPGQSQQWLSAAVRAWQWADQNPVLAYKQPSDVTSGEYGDENVSDERKWAAAELFLTTEDEAYLTAFNAQTNKINVPSWQSVAALGYLSLSHHGKTLLSTQDYEQIKGQVIGLADKIVTDLGSSPYLVPMTEADYVWGSNSVAANKALILNSALQQTDDRKYKLAMADILSYLLGRNPTDYSFITGFGDKPPMHIHHRPSVSDNVVDPIPGLLAGGPQNGQQDGCDYPANLPATSYVDDWCSFASNEIAINWNAPLVYLLASVIQE
jgi:endoglucanase